MGLLSFLFGLIDPVSKIADKIAQVQIEKAKALTDREKISADERIKALEAKKDVIIAEAGTGVNQFVRAAITAPFIIYFWKLIVWDKIIMAGTTRTDDLNENLWWVSTVIIGFYFITDVTRQITRQFRR